MTDAVATIEFYWRPGCPFCTMLERKLTNLDIELDKRNIWDEPEHAAIVRSIADGNETVPTVVVGDAKLVNPSAAQVIQAIENNAPDLLPEGVHSPEPGALGRRINRFLGGSR